MTDEKTITVNRVDPLVMRQLKIQKMIALKLQALSHINIRLIIAASTLLQQKYEHPFSLYLQILHVYGMIHTMEWYVSHKETTSILA